MLPARWGAREENASGAAGGERTREGERERRRGRVGEGLGVAGLFGGLGRGFAWSNSLGGVVGLGSSGAEFDNCKRLQLLRNLGEI